MTIEAGATDPNEDGPAAPSWGLTISIAFVILIAGLVGIVALTDDGSSSATASAGGADPSSPTTLTTSSTSTPRTSTTTTTTAPPPTEPPTTIAPPSTPPPPTVPPAAVPAIALPAGWVPVTSTDGHLAAAFPSPPQVATALVPSIGGPATRTDYSAQGPGGSIVSLSSVRADVVGRTSDDYFFAVAERVRSELGGTFQSGAATTVAGLPALGFRVRVPHGQVRSVVLVEHDQLVTVSMYTPGRGDTGAADLVFDVLVSSLAFV